MLENYLALPLPFHVGFAAFLGLMVGSFLNVLIYRYPKMLQFQWTSQSYEWLNKETYLADRPASLTSPASHCFSCKAPIEIWQNIPVISYILLRGKCGNCDAKISIRYPLVELLTAFLSAYVVIVFGATLQALFGVLLTWVLVALAFIDFDNKLLPDDIVMPVLWLGIGLSLLDVFASPQDAIIGTIVGYLSFWIVYQVFKLITGKEGMGYGDFKLMALFGAWFGWQYIPQIILISTISGTIIGITLMVLKKAKGESAIPFGPYIAAAGYIAMLWGDKINAMYWSQVGVQP